MILFWWTFDDHLAIAMNMPGLGHLEWWIPLMVDLAFGSINGSSNRATQ